MTQLNEPLVTAGLVEVDEWRSDLVAACLRWSPCTAAHRLDVAVTLVEGLAATLQLLEAGEISAGRRAPARLRGRALPAAAAAAGFQHRPRPALPIPRCGRRADACDVDHVCPHGDQGGKMAACNCCTLCRKHHRAKTHGGWHLELHADSSAIWIAPNGRLFHADPVNQLE